MAGTVVAYDLTWQEVRARLQQATESQSADALQEVIQRAPEVLQRHGEELLPSVLDVCDVSHYPARKLTVLNTAWKALLLIVTAPSVSLALFHQGVDFILQQLHWSIFSHDWTDPKRAKLATFVASYVVSTVRAHPRLFLCADESHVSQVVELYYAVATTIATSERPASVLLPLYDGILIRLSAIVYALGCAACENAKETDDTALDSNDEAGGAAAAAFPGRPLDLLRACVSESAAAHVQEEAGGCDTTTAMTTAVASFGCFLHATRGIVHGMAREDAMLTEAGQPTLVWVLRALLGWLPGAAKNAALEAQSDRRCHTGDCSDAAESEIGGEALVSRVAHLAAALPHTAWSTGSAVEETEAAAATATGSSPRSASTEEPSLRQAWVDCVTQLLRLAGEQWRGSSQPLLMSTAHYLTAFAAPHPRSLALLLETWSRLCVQVSASVGSSSAHASDHALAEALQGVLSAIAVLGTSTERSGWYSGGEGGTWWQAQWLCCMAMLLGTGCAVDCSWGCPPSTLLPELVVATGAPSQWSTSAFAQLADVWYAISTLEGPVFSAAGVARPTSPGGDCTSADVRAVLRRVLDAHASSTTLSEGQHTQQSSPQLLLLIPIALRRLRRSLLSTPDTAPEQLLCTLHDALRELAPPLASVAAVVQQLCHTPSTPTTTTSASQTEKETATALKTSMVVPRFVAAAVLRELAFFPAVSADTGTPREARTSSDEVVMACVRRWIDAAFDDTENGHSALARFWATQSLLCFAEHNPDVHLEKLRLPELAATDLMQLLECPDAHSPATKPGDSQSVDVSAQAAEEQYARDAVWYARWEEAVQRSAHQVTTTNRLPGLPTEPASSSSFSPTVSELLHVLRRCQRSLKSVLESADFSVNNDENAANLSTAKSWKRPRGWSEEETADVQASVHDLLRVGQLVNTVLLTDFTTSSVTPEHGMDELK